MTLTLASIYLDLEMHLTPVKVYFRGRIYYDVTSLLYQGNDLCRAIIEFALREKLSKNNNQGINIFKSVGATFYSKKLSKVKYTIKKKVSLKFIKYQICMN